MKQKKRPQIALVGRVNVGKSSIFNRLTGSRTAIVSTHPGTTRDVRSGIVYWRGLEFEFIDTGGVDGADSMSDTVERFARRSWEAADLVLLVVDGKAGVLPQDRTLVQELRQSHKTVWIIVNKLDRGNETADIPNEFHSLPFELIGLSAKNGRGSGELLDAIAEQLQGTDIETDTKRPTKVAIIGRPNVGKSSLINSILGHERVIVADEAHTTRESNDIPFTFGDSQMILIDTAGIRRRNKVGGQTDKLISFIERSSVRQALIAIKRSDVVICVMEAQQSISQQDKKILQLAAEHGKAVVIAINKWDLIEEKTPTTINDFREYFDQAIPFLRWAPMIFISALEHQRVTELLQLVQRVAANFSQTISEEVCDSALQKMRSAYRPRSGKKLVKFISCQQIENNPPHLLIVVNRPKEVPPALVHIFENTLRDLCDLEGVQVTIEVRAR